jgi:hypothetical protein
MQWIVDHFYLFILLLGVVHLFVLLSMWLARRRMTDNLASYLFNLVKNFSTGTDHRPGGTIYEQIDSFIADIREVTLNPGREADRDRLYHRVLVKDETKSDIHGTKLETWYNLARTGIEAYPLLGILGTIFAIALGLNVRPTPPAAPPGGTNTAIVTPDAPAASPDAVSPATSGQIIRNFANSIWSTAAGIGFAIILMLINALIEPGFERLSKQRQAVRDAIAAAKIHLGLGVTDRLVIRDAGGSGAGGAASVAVARSPT